MIINRFPMGGGINKTLPPQIDGLTIFEKSAQGGQVTLSGSYSSITNLSGTLIVYKQGATPPAEVGDGTKVSFAGTSANFVVNGLKNDVQYSFRVFPYNDNLQYQTDIIGAVISGTPTVLLPNQISNLKIEEASASGTQVVLSGNYSSTNYLSGTRIVYKQGTSYPQSPTDGVIQDFAGTANKFTIGGLALGQTYSFRVFPYNAYNIYQTQVAQIQGTTTNIVAIGYQFDINQTNPTLTRHGGAIGKNFAVAHSKTEVVQNDFDNLFPFNKMQRVNFMSRTMVKVPKFYVKYLYDGAIDGRMISSTQLDNTYKPHPLFLKGNIEYSNSLEDNATNFNDFAYVASYFTSPNAQSVTGSSPQCKTLPSNFRTQARAIGAGWTAIDWTYYDFLTTIWFCASGTRDSQSLMPCNQSGAKTINGLSDGSASTCVQIGNTVGLFYGIENPFSGMFQWIDGVSISQTKYLNITTKIDIYNTSAGTRASYKTTNGFISKKGYDERFPFFRFATEGGGSDTTYYCDSINTGSSTWYAVYFGGDSKPKNEYGISKVYGQLPMDSSGNEDFGSRLLYRAF